MPLKLNTGVSRKKGQPNFGSVQASCSLELELTSDIIHDYDRFQQQVRNAFRFCEQAVDEQLGEHTQILANNQFHSANGNGHSGNQVARPATQSQIRAINAIAGKQRIDLSAFLRTKLGCKSLDSLSVKQASEVIDELKATQSGNGVGR